MAGHSIVGRQPELDRLREFARGNHPAGLALIEGEAGVGKTVLWSSVVDDARERGVRVLVARPSAAEAGSAYGALDDLVRPAIDTLAELPEPRRRALAVALLLEDAEAAPEPRAVALGLLSLLGAGGPALLAVDDWQWLDRSTATVLGFAVRRLAVEDGLRVLATVRSGEADADVAALVRSLPEERVVQLGLEPLGPSELLQLVHERTGRWLSPPALTKLHEASGGNPLAALELARSGGDGSVAVDVQRLLWGRIATLSPAARDVLRGVAALSVPTAPLVEASTEAPDGALVEALDSEILERDGDQLRFAHPLFAAVIEQRTAPERWRALHRRLADLVTEGEQRARHLALGASGPDAEVAGELHRAAAGARARGAPSAAAELAERAAELTMPDEPELRARRLFDAAEGHREAGDGENTERVLDQLVEELEPGPLRADALNRLAWILPDARSEQAAERALAEAGDDDRMRAWSHLTLSNMLTAHGKAAEARRHAELARRHAERSGDPSVRARTLVELSLRRFRAGEGVQHELLLEAGRLERQGTGPWRAPSALTALGHHLYQSGELDRGRRYLVEELDRVAGNLEFEVILLLRLVDLEVLAGRWQEADQYAQRGLESAIGGSLYNTESAMRWARALVDAHLGRVDTAREHAERSAKLADEVGDYVFSVHGRAVLGFVSLSLGDAREAVALLEPLPADIVTLGQREPMVYRVDPNLAEALVLTGNLEGARVAQERLDAAGRERDRPWAIATAARCRGLIRSAEGDYDAALAAHHEALELLERVGQPFERARTLLALGAVQRRAKRRGDARASLDAALALFTDLGAVLWAERARGELARIGGRRTSDDLTPTERRIAELAAAGSSNREIAAELFVSERTVEANLTRVYRKLGVRSRTQLVRRLPAGG